jgi:hypothetical protein
VIAPLDSLAEEMLSPTLDSVTRFAVRSLHWMVSRRKCDRLSCLTNKTLLIESSEYSDPIEAQPILDPPSKPTTSVE